ncbi:hypothetical protein Btru_010731 [Bulinus truncatus]|nr:hypothetical protein Btru_010731 [Bulinus truncatus]
MMDIFFGQAMEDSHCELHFSSHRAVEKKRREKINKCLIALSETVPAEFSSRPSGKLEKAEILEMTVLYLKSLKAKARSSATVCMDPDKARAFQDGYRECVDVVRDYLISTLGHKYLTRCQGLLHYLQTRCLQSHLMCLEKMYSLHINKQTKSLQHHQTSQQSTEWGGTETNDFSRRSWDEEFKALKQALIRK